MSTPNLSISKIRRLAGSDPAWGAVDGDARWRVLMAVLVDTVRAVHLVGPDGGNSGSGPSSSSRVPVAIHLAPEKPAPPVNM
jgi:hypothetical protein